MRSPGKIEADLLVPARPVTGVRDAVAGCDLVVAITTAKAPVFDGHWIEDGAHVTGAGSNTPAKRELDDIVFQRSKLIVDFRDQALQEAGDLQQALRSGAIREEAIHAELGEVITGSKTGRTSDREITLFKSVGMAIEDLTTASFAYQQALTMGLGTYLPLEGTSAEPRASIPAASHSGSPSSAMVVPLASSSQH
jgi:alanine dehydrogenase